MLKRTPLKRGSSTLKRTYIKKVSAKKMGSIIDRVSEGHRMKEFFFSIWETRPHVSEVSGTFLGSTPSTVFFHHILPKSKYKEAAYDKNNIILLTFDEHTLVENNPNIFEEVNKRRELLLLEYN